MPKFNTCGQVCKLLGLTEYEKRPLIFNYLIFPAGNLLPLPFSLLSEPHYSQQQAFWQISWPNPPFNEIFAILIIAEYPPAFYLPDHDMMQEAGRIWASCPGHDASTLQAKPLFKLFHY